MHQSKADKGYQLVKELTKDADDSTWVVVMDLQQALPTPKVTAGIAFYKRKLWTFNFCIYDLKNGRGYMHVWDEVTAKRGSIEICSCIYKFVTTEVPPTVKRLIIVSDNCPGQNKNYLLILFYMFLTHRRFFEEIVHVFLRPGHTYNSADQTFGNIESNIRLQRQINTPQDYIDIIKSTRERRPFIVTKMEQSDFLDFEILKRSCTRRTPNGIRFSDAAWFRVTKEYNIGYELATDYFSLGRGLGQHVRLAKGRGKQLDRHFNLNYNMNGRLKYSRPIPLKKAKLEDLRCLVFQLVPRDSIEKYWQEILGNPTSEETEIDDDEDDSGDGGFGDIFDY